MAQQIPNEHFVDALSTLWEEVLGTPAREGGNTWVLDHGAGWAQTLADVSAAEASRPVAPGASTIAAHTAHAAYYLEGFVAIVENRHEKPDWPGSFRPAEVDEAEWARQRSRFHGVAERVGALLRGNPQWQREQVAGAMAQLAHLTYHLGAVRQMLRVVKG